MRVGLAVHGADRETGGGYDPAACADIGYCLRCQTSSWAELWRLRL